MTGEADNLILPILRRVDQRTERMSEDIHDMKSRLTNVEEGLAGVNRRVDRLDERLEKIEKHLGLIDA